MLRPCKIIASGSSGLEIARRVIELLYTMVYDDVTKLKAVQILVVETEKTRAENLPREYRSDLFIPDDNLTIPRTLKAYLNSPTRFDWFDELYEKYQLDILGSFHDGAGGVRPRGRLALWLNWRSVYDKVKMQEFNPNDNNQLLARYLNVGDAQDDRYRFVPPQKVCYIVGTLGGGTCSGNFLDLAYMVEKNHEQKDMKKVGIFLVPPSPGGIGAHNRMMMAGVYSALKEWQYYDDKQLGYCHNWPEMGKVDYSDTGHKQPFDLLYLLEPSSATSLAEAYDKVAYRIFLDIIGMEAKASAQRADAHDLITSSNIEHNLWTFNLCGLVYPKYQLVRLAALKKSAEYLQERLQASDESVNAAKAMGFTDMEQLLETEFITHAQNVEIQNGKSYWGLWVGDRAGDKDSLISQYMRGSKSVDEIFQTVEQWKSEFKTGAFFNSIVERIAAEAWGKIENVAAEYETVPYVTGYVQGMFEATKDTAEFWRRTFGNIGNEELKEELRKIKWYHWYLKREKQRDTFQFIFYKALIEAAGDMILQRLGENLQSKNALESSTVGSTVRSWTQTVEDWKNEALQGFEDHKRILTSHGGETLRYVDRKGRRIEQSQQISDEVEAFSKAVNFGDIPREKKKALLLARKGAAKDLERFLIRQILEMNREIRINSGAVQTDQLQHSYDLSKKPGVQWKGEGEGLSPLYDGAADKGFCNFVITHSSNYDDVKSRSGHKSNSDHNIKPIPMAIEPEVILFYNEFSQFEPEKLKLWDMGKKAFEEMVDNHAEQKSITFLWMENWVHWKTFTQKLKPSLRQLRDFLLDYGLQWAGSHVQGVSNRFDCGVFELSNNTELRLLSPITPNPHFNLYTLGAEVQANDATFDQTAKDLSALVNYSHLKAILTALNAKCQALQGNQQRNVLNTLEENAKRSYSARPDVSPAEWQNRINAHRQFINATLPEMVQFLTQNPAP